MARVSLCAYLLCAGLGASGYVSAAIAQESPFIRFERCPYIGENPPWHWYVYKDTIAEIGTVPKDYFLHDPDFELNPKVFTECSFVITTYGKSMFVKGKVEDWVALLGDVR